MNAINLKMSIGNITNNVRVKTSGKERTSSLSHRDYHI